MLRLNGSYFLTGGAALQALRPFQADSRFMDIWQAVWAAEDWLGPMLQQNIFHLRTSLSAGFDLLQLLRQMKTKIEEAFKGEKGDEHVGWDYANLLTAVNSFTTLLAAELRVSDFYFVTNKGCYDTTRLIESGADLFPPELASKVPNVVLDCSEVGKCIAFGLPTAAAFHLHRINEAVLREYFSAVLPGTAHPEKKTIRAYVDAMKNAHLDNKQVLGALSTLNSFHRNPVIHPDQSLVSVDEAIALLGIVQACVQQMLKEVPQPPLKLESPVGSVSGLSNPQVE